MVLEDEEMFYLLTMNWCACVCVWQARQAELEAARLAKEKEEEEAKQAAQQAKKEKEIQKKAIKKERQKLRTTCKVSFMETRGDVWR